MAPVTKDMFPPPPAKLPEGPLTEPITPPKPPPKRPNLMQEARDPASVDEYQQDLNSWAVNTAVHLGQQRLQKLGMLLEHYNIDPNDGDKWLRLSMLLSEQYVPGFAHKPFPKKRGAPSKWNDQKHADLFCAVMIKKEEREKMSLPMSESDICRLLAKDPAWSGYGGAKALLNELMKAKKTGIVEKLIMIHESELKNSIHVYKSFYERHSPNKANGMLPEF